MAPKNKFTREEMVEAALQVVREKGIDALTAKALAEELGISTQPVFTCFATMDVVKEEVRAAAERVYDSYAAEGLRQDIPFRGFGMQYVRFAKEEPELYRLLFLTKGEGNFDAMGAMKRSQTKVRPYIEQTYHLSAGDANRYFRDLWLVVHSIAILMVTGACPYTDKEIGQILASFSLSICKAIKEVPGFTDENFDADETFRILTER